MTLWAGIAGAAAVSAGLVAGLGRADEATLVPAVAWMGSKSLITTPRYERITTAERWAEVWHEHTGEGRQFKDPTFTIPPAIDFGRYMVIAYFRGPSVNTNGEQVESVAEADGVVRIRFDSMSYQTASFNGDGGAVSVVPFGLWVIERTTKPVAVEENVQGLIGKPPIWKEQHRFEAMK